MRPSPALRPIRASLATFAVLALAAPRALAQIVSTPPAGDYNVAGQPMIHLPAEPRIHVVAAYLPEQDRPGDMSGYVRIANTGDADQLVGVSCADAQGTTLSETNPKKRRYPGLSPMGSNELPVLLQVPMPARSELLLKPGGVHIVLQDMAYTPRPGQVLGCTLDFALYGPVDFPLPVVTRDATAPF